MSVKLYANYSNSYKNCDHIVKIFNGQGNQFFEYAFGYILEKETGTKICYDKTFFQTNKRELHERYILDAYNLPKMDFVQFSKQQNKIFRKYKVISKTDNIWSFDKKLLFPEGDHAFYTYNYFSEHYYDKYYNDIVKIFTLKIPLNKENQKMLTEIKKHKNSVSIHIRRGDYINNNNTNYWGNVVTIDNYYKKALKIFEKMDDIHYFIFSDDHEWVKQHFKTGKPTTYVNINDIEHGYFDLELMKNCKHNVIANSTFSWWGAYLNTNKDKIVIAPAIFARHEPDRSQLGLSNWVKIDNN